jgi:hypothetical protein
MSTRWEEGAGRDHWPVRYALEESLQGSSGRFRERAPDRWVRVDKPDAARFRKRILWLLLAVEAGMALAAVVLVPLSFMNLPVGRGGIIAHLLAEVGQLLGTTAQVAFLALVLPVPALLLALGLILLLVDRIETLDEARSCRVSE